MQHVCIYMYNFVVYWYYFGVIDTGRDWLWQPQRTSKCKGKAYNYTFFDNQVTLLFSVNTFPPTSQPCFSQTHKIGIIANFLLPFTWCFLTARYGARKCEIRYYWVKEDYISRLQTSLLWFISYGTLETTLAFLYCGEWKPLFQSWAPIPWWCHFRYEWTEMKMKIWVSSILHSRAQHSAAFYWIFSK